jgi:hypothetical protein
MTTDKWEYATWLQSDDPVENLKQLNGLGALGWELIHVGRVYYIFKRRLLSA